MEKLPLTLDTRFRVLLSVAHAECALQSIEIRVKLKARVSEWMDVMIIAARFGQNKCVDFGKLKPLIPKFSFWDSICMWDAQHHTFVFFILECDLTDL